MVSHRERILDQFTKQAIPFSSSRAMTDEASLRLLVELTGATAKDTVLDVACGPGIVVCAFASLVEHATGIDLTPAMIERGQTLQAGKGLRNVTWRTSDLVPLPFPDESFSIVTSRYAFHHLLSPQAALSEMQRVCKIGGKVVLIDAMASAGLEQADAFNRMERLRDPSHVRALTLAEMQELFEKVGLPGPQMRFYKVDVELEGLLRRSFPNERDAEKVRRMVIDSLKNDGMGVNTRREDGGIWFSYPIAVLMGEKQNN